MNDAKPAAVLLGVKIELRTDDDETIVALDCPLATAPGAIVWRERIYTLWGETEDGRFIYAEVHDWRVPPSQLSEGASTEQTLTPGAILVDGEWVPRERIISPEQLAVLDAMARVHSLQLSDEKGSLREACEAELARRDGTKAEPCNACPHANCPIHQPPEGEV